MKTCLASTALPYILNLCEGWPANTQRVIVFIFAPLWGPNDLLIHNQLKMVSCLWMSPLSFAKRIESVFIWWSLISVAISVFSLLSILLMIALSSQFPFTCIILKRIPSLNEVIHVMYVKAVCDSGCHVWIKCNCAIDMKCISGFPTHCCCTDLCHMPKCNALCLYQTFVSKFSSHTHLSLSFSLSLCFPISSLSLPPFSLSLPPFSLCMCMRVCVCVCVCICVYVCGSGCMYVCIVYVCIYIYTCVYKNANEIDSR